MQNGASLVKMMAPVLTELKKSLSDKITILKVDVDKTPAPAQAYRVQGVPTLILFKDGAVKWRQSGVVASAELQKVISSYS